MVKEIEHTNGGIAALVLGILGLILIFLPWMGLPFRSDILAIPIAILAVVLGNFARKYEDNYGNIGLVLGVITLIIIILIVTFTTPVYVESGQLP
jgi:hypothetical protein